VDGQAAPVWRANHAFQTLEVPAGQHSVKLVYEDRSFRIGAVISGFSVFVCAVTWIGSRKKKELREIQADT
jgi:uncharacterized membrane protein YfhO